MPQTVTAWTQLAPRYEALASDHLTPEHAPDWLRHWSDLEKDVWDIRAHLTRAKDANPSDRDAEEAYLAFLQHVQPEVTRASHGLNQKLLALSGWQPEAQHEQMLRQLRNAAALFREENVTLETEAHRLANEFNKITGAQRAVVNGEALTLPEAQRLLLQPDRGVRESAWRAIMAARLKSAPQLDAVFLELLKLRRQMARNAGFPNYRDYVWQAMNRFDYSPRDTRTLHEAVEQTVTPLLARVFAERRAAFGLDALRPWDTSADSQGRAALVPFTGTQELEDIAQRIFEALDRDLGAQFARMREGGYLDLEPRAEKVPGYGYCDYFPRALQPFIYWSAVGTDGDVRVLMHEAGHAFHFLASGQPHHLVWNFMSPIEFAEVGSQAMELLTLPLLERPVGFYDAEDAARARRDKLETVLRQFISQATADAFQQWLYAEAPEDVTIAQIDAKWLECAARFERGVDTHGLDRERAKGWQFVHVFAYPLYMLEYSLAWIGALQIWRGAQHNPALALERYKAALALGGTCPLPELFEAAGARFAFDEATLRELMGFVEEQLFGTPGLQG
ncbi:M3 family oligoendopeptidase [Deinococcus peraridilitoris]|uniref:Oligoendopeptidase F n=1 Tax=Deinococcus peraridilitoris (strain DSM 19664 / LMG 22246 / CIP 109416 / KR-200) TaxID=937777 RepID=L0A2K1_DEIPD|nr:M3 family oligoendopeptidase [Deinococcus peraridilitoris]AFZ68076.1 oligoendopeptidase F [Deinococcus peraridilitoris DSM 19664]